jgi:hypothetical protein
VRLLVLLVVIGSVATPGCGIPLVNTRLEPVPATGAGAAPLKAQIRKVAVTHDLLAAGANLDTGSRLGVEIDVYNADAQRTVTVRAPQLVLRDALGGPDVAGRPVVAGDRGLPPTITISVATSEMPPLTLRPGEGKTIWIGYAGFPPDGPRGPVHAVVRLPSDGGTPQELVIANPVPGGPRWHPDRLMIAGAIGGTMSAFQTGSGAGSGDMALAPLRFDVIASWRRLFWGFAASYQFLYREAVAGGPLALGPPGDVSIGFLPWRFPVGVYGQFGYLFATETPPAAYAQIDGSDGGVLFLPRVGAGIILNIGTRIASSGPFPIDRPLSPLRRLQFRIGYSQWFRLGSAAGSGAIEAGLMALIGP